jgi:hypothetical protein
MRDKTIVLAISVQHFTGWPISQENRMKAVHIGMKK